MSAARITLLALVLGGCAVAPVPESTAPAETTSAAAPAPSEPKTPPVSFAAPPVLLEDSGARIAPADIPVPGYHCHWIGPGKRYCHGGMD